MTRLTGQRIVVDAPLTEVFDFMADCSNELAWNPDVKDIHRLTDGPVGAGTEWQGSYRGMGDMLIRLDEYEPSRRLTFTTRGNRLDMRFTFDYHGDDAHTEAVVDAEIAPKGALRLAGPLIGPMMRRTLAQRPGQIRAGLEKARLTR